MINRRMFNFLATALTTPKIATVALTSDLLLTGTSEERMLARCVAMFGASNVIEEIARRMGDIDLNDVRRELNRVQKQNKRHAAASDRRMKHTDNVIVRSRCTLSEDVKSIICSAKLVESNVTGRDLLCTATRQNLYFKDIVIPEGSRLLVDLRRTLVDPGIEIVKTDDGRTRLHLWQPQQETKTPVSLLDTIQQKPPEHIDNLYEIQDDL